MAEASFSEDVGGEQLPRGPAVGGFQQAGASIGIEREMGLASSCVDSAGGGWVEGDSAHGKGSFAIGQRSPGSPCVRGGPNTALSSADQPVSRISGIDGNGRG